MDLLTPGTGLIIWQAFVFFLLVLLLSRLAWKPILSALKEREQTIQDALDSAQKAREEMAQLKSENEQILKLAREERDKVLKDARLAAQRIQDDAKADASKQADKMIQDARMAINTEKQAALTDIKVQVATLALQVSERLLKKNLESEKSQQELIQSYLKELNLN
ncbi:MAG TPA: F0F1 ATP synthase subunit B [Cyclobacteriaceae bacterium]|nr:F0F1 ATP synthase subunit B [Cyclobacteriaceae bacterium]